MISSNPPSRLVKHIIRSYARLAENTRVRPVLRENLPQIIKDKSFYSNLDESSKRWLQNLMKLLSSTSNPNPQFPGANINPLNMNINPLMGNQMMNPNPMTNTNMTNIPTMMNMHEMNGYPYNYGEGYLDGNGKGMNNMYNNMNKNFMNINNGFIYKNGK
jgi:hypothetical protein